MLHLFCVRDETLSYGREHYQQYSPETSFLLLCSWLFLACGTRAG